MSEKCIKTCCLSLMCPLLRGHGGSWLGCQVLPAISAFFILELHDVSSTQPSLSDTIVNQLRTGCSSTLILIWTFKQTHSQGRALLSDRKRKSNKYFKLFLQTKREIYLCLDPLYFLLIFNMPFNFPIARVSPRE